MQPYYKTPLNQLTHVAAAVRAVAMCLTLIFVCVVKQGIILYLSNNNIRKSWWQLDQLPNENWKAELQQPS